MKSNTNLKTLVIGCVLAAIILTSSISAFADQEKYIGFWKSGTGSNKVLKFDSREEFTEQWEELGKKNMRLQDLEVLKGAEGVKYIGTWVSGKGKYALIAHDSFTEFAEEWKEMLKDKALRLIDVEVVTIGDKNHYIGVWDTGKGGSALFQFNNWEDFTNKWKELAKDGRVLTDVEAFKNGGSVSFVGVWESGIGKDQRLIKADSFNEFDKYWKDFNKEDLRLVDIDVATVGSGELYIGVWNKGTGGQFLWQANSLAQLQAKNTELSAQKLDLVDFAAVNFGKPAQPKPPQGKPAQPTNKNTLYFSKGASF